MHRLHRTKESGFSLIVALLALMLLSAIAIGMMFQASTETWVSSNFKAEENAYFAARAGVEEARDRMRATSANPIVLPTGLPPAAGSVLYIKQTGVSDADITTAGGKLSDDELCHDFPAAFSMSTATPNVPCASAPDSGWMTTTASVAPYPLDYKWVRVTQKLNNSSPYWVVPSPAPASNLVCWDGTSEVATGAACSGETLPVYLVTALAVTQTGARRLVQQEIALTQTSVALPGGMFATSRQCPALILKGGAKTGSFDSATENPVTTPPSNCVLSGGDIGANGGVQINGGTGSTATTCSQLTGSTAVNGNVSTGTGVCPGNGVTESGTPTVTSTSQNPVYTPPTPPAPTPPPTTKCPAPGVPASKHPPTPAIPPCTIPATLPPGSYGDYTISGTMNLVGGADINHPAIYTFNSLAEGSANAQINVTGPVVINLAGAPDANLTGNPPTVLNLTGNGFANSSGIPDYLVINYGGSDNISMNGNSTFYGVINAPNANITFNGSMQYFGQVIGSTIDDEGGASFFWDTSAKTTVTTTQPYYSEISLRELSY
jgi:hypothetical protein